MYDFWPNGRNGKRVRKTLPDNIKNEEQAEQFAQKFRHLYHFQPRLNNIPSMDVLFSSAMKYFEENEDHSKCKELRNSFKSLLQYFKTNNMSEADCLEPSPTVIEYFVQERARTVSSKTINKELAHFNKLHNFWCSQGYCLALSFEIIRFYIKDKTVQKTFSEKFYELLIESYPAQFLGKELTFIDKPPVLNRLLPDSLFASANGSFVVVEIQKKRLDRTHAYKILEYRDKLEKCLAKDGLIPNIAMMVVVIGDICSAERQEFLDKYGIELIILPFQKIEKTILNLLCQREDKKGKGNTERCQLKQLKNDRGI